MAKVQKRFIVAIDYGTTSTKIAYHFAGNPTENITFVQNWPAGDGKRFVPSRIVYLNDRVVWGYEIKPTMTVAAWSKLLLDPPSVSEEFLEFSPSAREVHGILYLAGKDAVDVVTDFLRTVFGHLRQELVSVSEVAFDSIGIDYWISVPVGWGDAGRSSMERAARAAFGLRGQDEMQIVTEAEATAHGILKDMQFEVGDAVLICDCGGGTVVDTSVYCVGQAGIRPYVRQIGPQKGAQYGGTTIDLKLYVLLSDRFRDRFDDLALGKKPQEASRPRYELELPGMRVRQPNPDHYGNQKIVLFNDTCCDIFNFVIDKIVRVIEPQMDEAAASIGGQRIVKKIFMVGGFSNSPYPQQRVRGSLVARYGVELIFPPNPELAVVYGAVMLGSHGPFTRTPKFPASYGFNVCRSFQDGDNVDAAIDNVFIYGKLSENIMSWAIRKGEEKEATFSHIEPSTLWRIGQPLTTRVDIFSCESEAPPSQFLGGNPYAANLRHVNSLEVDFSKTNYRNFPTINNRIYLFRFEVEVTTGELPYMLKFTARSPGRELLGETPFLSIAPLSRLV
ncbi:hypothetical protein BJX99DRAFT_265216 [Aspergillus californicus]